MAKKKAIPSPSLFEEKTIAISNEPVIAKNEAIADSKETLQQIVDKRDKVIEPTPQITPSPRSGEGRGEVVLMDGTILRIGDECTITDDILDNILKFSHKEKTFILEKFTQWDACKSGTLVIAYMKDNPEIKTVGIGKKGIDANWFKKVDNE